MKGRRRALSDAQIKLIDQWMARGRDRYPPMKEFAYQLGVHSTTIYCAAGRRRGYSETPKPSQTFAGSESRAARRVAIPLFRKTRKTGNAGDSLPDRSIDGLKIHI